jgi:hypothetical protein
VDLRITHLVSHPSADYGGRKLEENFRRILGGPLLHQSDGVKASNLHAILIDIPVDEVTGSETEAIEFLSGLGIYMRSKSPHQKS